MRRIILFSCLLLALASPLFAALPAATVFEVRQAGNPNNGGCFVTGSTGTDFSQQNGNQYTFSDLVLPSTTTGTSVSHSFVASDVGNCLHITAGTNCTVGFYQIVSVAAGTATFDRAAGTVACVAGTFFVGGALALPTQPANTTTGNIIWMKADGTYTTTVQLTYAVADGVLLAGYTTSRGDNGSATIQLTSGSGISPIFNANNGSGNGNTIKNLIVDCNNQTTAGGIGGANGSKMFMNIQAKNCKATGINISGGSQCFYCLVTLQTTGSSFTFGSQFGNICFTCYVTAPTSTTGAAFAVGSGTCINCMGVGHASSGIDVFQISTTGGTIINSGCFNSGRDCYRYTQGAGQDPANIVNSIAYTAVGFCYNSQSGSTVDILNEAYIDYLGAGNCTGGSYGNFPTPAHATALTADPWVASGSNNFALNGTAGGGQAVKGVGFPGATGVIGTGNMSLGPLPPATSAQTVHH